MSLYKIFFIGFLKRSSLYVPIPSSYTEIDVFFEKNFSRVKRISGPKPMSLSMKTVKGFNSSHSSKAFFLDETCFTVANRLLNFGASATAFESLKRSTIIRVSDLVLQFISMQIMSCRGLVQIYTFNDGPFLSLACLTTVAMLFFRLLVVLSNMPCVSYYSFIACSQTIVRSVVNCLRSIFY